MNKNAKAGLLFDAIGDLDDKYIVEAVSRPAARKRASGIRRAFLIAAAALFSVVLTVAVPLSVRNSIKEREPDDVSEIIRLEDCFEKYRGNNGFAVTGDPQFSAKTSRIVWQYDGDDGYYSMSVRGEELAKLSDLMDNSTAIPGSGNEKAVSVKVWFVDPAGYVVSPYLRKGGGNIYVRELFDYDPEVVPSDEMVKLISDLFEAKTT